MGSNIPYIINNEYITLFLNNEPYIIEKSHEHYYDIIKNLNENKDIKHLIKSKFKYINNNLYYKDKLINPLLKDYILYLEHNDLDLTLIYNFLDKLYENPDEDIQNELYEFLANNRIPITIDGNLITYKRVTYNYKDIFTQTIDNSIGAIVEIDRAKVDNNRNNLCSYGLHVCSHYYLQYYERDINDRIIICEVNPKDVVAIPNDYNNAKMRVCKYKVINELQNYHMIDKFDLFVSVEDSNIKLIRNYNE